ncbi:polycystin-2-like [Procambarus clarkii]|uniref:polycystin-2-like n=1 Tax=Procambarus clarkii TaxID=6728 RepID=UPI00374253FC
MQNAANLDEIFSYLIAFIVFVGTLKFIKLLRFNKTIGLLSATIRRCWDDLSVFLIAFVLFFFAFVSVFFVLLNQHLVDFYNFISAVMTCFSILLGKFDFSQMTQASPMVPILFFVFVMFITFVLMNLLITVIMQAFTEVKEDLHNQPRDHEIVDYVWESFKTFLRRGDSSDRAPRLISTTTVNIDLNTHDSVTVQEFPDKINKFLDYVNATYFEGGLDVTSKDAFKSSMYKSYAPRQGSGTRGISFRDV